jgi:HEAT repeat protein
MNTKPSHIHGVSIPYGASVTELKEMMHAPAPQRWAAFVALGHSAAIESLELLAERLLSKDSHVRRAALEAIGTHAEGRRCEQGVLRCFSDSSDEVIRQACRTAASLGLSSAHDDVLKLLDSPSGANRLVALGALSKLWHADDSERVIRILHKDDDANVRKEAAWALRKHATSDNCPALFAAWHGDAIPRHRAWACELAAEFRLSDVVDELARLTNDPDGHVRLAAQIALETLT